MKQSLRHQKIIKLVEQSGYLSTEELVAALDVSPQTIRRDLNILAELDLIRRHHGGAASPSSAENSDYVDRKQFFSLQKNNIAQEVAKLIPNGASLFIDIGTTPEAVANALLGHEKLRIVTNNLNAAHLLRQNESFDIVMAGGSLRMDGGIIGEATVNFISQFRLDFGILGISAIDADGSLLDYDYHEVQVKRAIIESSRQTLLVTDRSKFTRQAIVRLGELSDVEYLFTDDVPEGIANYLKAQKTKLVLCNGKVR
ncbi:TPA: DeoR/GlpR family transcriptional regulator [Haemophilus influenzae]|uniref:DeoR/GlpR family transcriptional regulator n=1 Tax=Haemophilus influenzae TaxID=727 RepID=UPI0005AED0A1|nr:DeoR/GlpR family transcriptional regulator [Haemophilus influenzae]KIP38482.1 transcriptional regulator [Haemophilus influenzae]KIP42642.1 transcriptional regulator [Haemophilus influenzae]KIP43368.1 transcriptional regulator [Haemophilus influenzae]KIP49032.1 transcriptional regulator [Haemophilus influenzae]MCK8904190.1 DeoR/GlpR family transcriptional regulator [Haemophilus influenzae]